jgi:hypothetical protein
MSKWVHKESVLLKYYCAGYNDYHLLIAALVDLHINCGSSSFGRAIAFQAIGGQFEPGLPLFLVDGGEWIVDNIITFNSQL